MAKKKVVVSAIPDPPSDPMAPWPEPERFKDAVVLDRAPFVPNVELMRKIAARHAAEDAAEDDWLAPRKPEPQGELEVLRADVEQLREDLRGQERERGILVRRARRSENLADNIEELARAIVKAFRRGEPVSEPIEQMASFLDAIPGRLQSVLGPAPAHLVSPSPTWWVTAQPVLALQIPHVEVVGIHYTGFDDPNWL